MDGDGLDEADVTQGSVDPPRPGVAQSPSAPSVFDVTAPLLPHSEAKAPDPIGEVRRTTTASGTWYRNDQDRYKSVYRRANPWYRRLARGLIALSLVTAVGVGIYIGASSLRDWLGRDKLPAEGGQVAQIGSTSFLITSRAPAPAVEGTLTIDTSSRAFEFVGTAGNGQLGTQVVSPDGSRVFLREGRGPWRSVAPSDGAATAVQQVIPYLLAVITPDDVLPNRLRKGFVDLVDKSQVGLGDDAIDRYDMLVDTAGLSADFPVQWSDYRVAVVPGIVESTSAPFTIWVDSANVVMYLRATQSNWEWQRLAYGPERFVPIDPTGVVPPAPTPSTAPPG